MASYSRFAELRATRQSSTPRATREPRLCGQAPSDHPDFAEFLVECGIDSVSVTPDSFVVVKQHVAAAES
ncbi:putative PEP-binding protein [Methylocapsa aurea]|uniref:putative PEP-binding protein n=1 Tax=Methylocapsa aurea TaxID=663610 RepID=UPI003D18AA25